MKSYFSNLESTDVDMLQTQRQYLCIRLRQRVRAARGNPVLLEMLARESVAMACDIPELQEQVVSHSSQDVSDNHLVDLYAPSLTSSPGLTAQ